MDSNHDSRGGALKIRAGFGSAGISRNPDERARLKVIQGPEFGHVYLVLKESVTIGRGEECDVQLRDLKASRVHAEVRFHADSRGGHGGGQIGGKWAVRDMGSQNGILHNGKRVRSAWLALHDTLSVGETTLQFSPSTESTQVLNLPARDPNQIRAEQVAFEAQRVRVRELALGKVSPRSSGSRGQSFEGLKSVPPGRLFIWIFLAGSMAFLVMPDSFWTSGGGKPAVKTQKPKEAPVARQVVTSAIPLTPETKRTAEMFMKQGLREFREKNFFRARQHFENVLQIAPAYDDARIYKERCNSELTQQIDVHLKQGKAQAASGKLKSSRNHFEAVLRILYRDPEHPSYLEAKQELDRMDKARAEGSN